jgi:omega-amidase
MIFVTQKGVLAHYDKRHLFAFGGENQRYCAGDDRVIIDYLGWRINLQICYDLRFPAWCRNRADYDLMLLVANWPAKRVHHWSSLLLARAIENQSWVIGVNRVGDDGNGLHYPGCSVVHDPMGAKLAELGSEETYRIITLDLAQVEETRANFPFQQDADPFTIG